MAERDNMTSDAEPRGASSRRVPFEHCAPHITQEPIDDTAADYATIDRYSTLEQRRGGRRHMGTASSDPEYLPPARVRGRDRAGEGGEGPAPGSTDSLNRRSGSLHYDRYLQLPNSGKAIFTSRQNRRRRRTHVALGVLIVLSIALALVWYFFLR